MVHVIRQIIREMRPHQWVKNLFVLAPLVFAQEVFLADGALNLASLGKAALAFALFCLLSGMVYILNDLVDREKDRLHPVKKLRPIASGALSVRAAQKTLVIGTIVALVLGAWLLSAMVVGVMAGYFLLNVAYSFQLKNWPFVDIACIAVGFLLRILGGALAVDVNVTGWLYACTFLLACFLALGKRTHELLHSGDDAASRRSVLKSYHANALKWAMGITAIATATCYAAYTFSGWAESQFGTGDLPWTLPFIVFGLARFAQIVHRTEKAESPTEAMIHDLPFLLNLLLWAAAVTYLIYL
jgi:decaprenyl-phosphate phosphoribosyltransferase